MLLPLIYLLACMMCIPAILADDSAAVNNLGWFCLGFNVCAFFASICESLLKGIERGL